MAARFSPSEPLATTLGFVALGVVLGFWTFLRLFPTVIPDPAAPNVLVIGGLVVLPLLPRSRLGEPLAATFSGAPLPPPAVLVPVRFAVQILTLPGIHAWLLIPPP